MTTYIYAKIPKGLEAWLAKVAKHEKLTVEETAITLLSEMMRDIKADKDCREWNLDSKIKVAVKRTLRRTA